MVLENILKQVFCQPTDKQKSLERRLKNTKTITYFSISNSLILTALYGVSSKNLVLDPFYEYLGPTVLTLAYVATIGLALQWYYLSQMKNNAAPSS